MSYRAITFGASGFTATGVDAIPNDNGEQDTFHAYLTPSSSAVATNLVALGAYPVAISSPNNGSRAFPVDTSFEPYRREAFRHRSIPAQRQSIMMTNIAGQGTVSTEGLWRREQTEWSMGAGQLYLDKKTDSQETRFYQSKGVDVFSYPLQATLLPDTYRKDTGTVGSNLQVARCGDYAIVANGTTLTRYALNVTGAWGAGTAATGLSGTINSITTNDKYAFVATTAGLYYGDISTMSFALYAASDTTSGFTGGYDLVRWVNDQLIAARANRLYAFQPRSSTGYPAYGAVPSVGDVQSPVTTISVSSTTATVTTSTAHGLVAGQPIALVNTKTQVGISTYGYGTAAGVASGVALVTTTSNHGLSVGETVTISGNSHVNGPVTATVLSVPSNTTFTCTTTESGSSSGSGNTGGVVVGDDVYGLNTTLNANYTVANVPSTTTFTITVPSSAAPTAVGGYVISSTVPDVLYTHNNPSWVWSDATGGATQVYFAGYVKGTSSYSGCIYRSNLMGSSTSTVSGITTVSNSQVAAPWNLNTPLQALPMSPDEYPTCIKSYLNFIFVGTNRGIRMAQTLSIYDPTATATGDLKAGPIIPNQLQPVTNPVTAIVGDGRFVWFSWSNYDGTSTGLGKLDLSTFINGDPLAPAYASDLMVTGQGIVNSLDWDTYNGCPLMAVAGLGVYAPYVQTVSGAINPYGASNSNTAYGGNVTVNKYVKQGTITSGLFDYGIPDNKIPVYFDYGVLAPVATGTSAQALVNIDPNDGDNAGIQTVTAYPNGNSDMSEYPLPQYKAEQFSVSVVLSSSSDQTKTPVLHRWTLKAWPASVQGTVITVVLQLFSVNVVDGLETYADPYDNFVWLETLRQNQDIIIYQEGPLAVQGIVESLDWLPHKRRGTYENGFEGDCVVSIKTIGNYTYLNPVTSVTTTA